MKDVSRTIHLRPCSTIKWILLNFNFSVVRADWLISIFLTQTPLDLFQPSMVTCLFFINPKKIVNVSKVTIMHNTCITRPLRLESLPVHYKIKSSLASTPEKNFSCFNRNSFRLLVEFDEIVIYLLAKKVVYISILDRKKYKIK